MEKDRIIQILDRWNFWHRKIDVGVRRSFYLDKIKKYLSSPEVIVLTGVRRSGKSTILLQIINDLIEDGVPPINTLIVNFEDPAFEVETSLSFLRELFDAYLESFNPKGKIYLFLDEVQLIDKWERFVSSLYDRKEKIKIFVTGSTSKLLQSDISTLLSGRYFSEVIYPLNFKEFLDFKKISYHQIISPQILHALKEYMELGGFPRVVLEKDKSRKVKVLEEYYSSIVERDIIVRQKLKNTKEVKELLLFLFSNIGNQISTYNIEKLLGLSNENTRRYLEYFEEAFLINMVDFFSHKVKQQIYNPKKVYCVDSGLMSVSAFKFSENKGKIAENIVFNHLLQNKKEVFYWKNKTEVDFVIRKKYQICEIYNVCWSLKEKTTIEREISSLEIAKKELKAEWTNLIYYEKEENLKIDSLKPIGDLLLNEPKQYKY
ncbi:hypothetical protein A2774_02635 [Candidatus Roizmanbacteria bacterium RIFCSPHIGHO2_01_FULL_39_12c]|uniref:AAA+ ATPase domain-containing protein n=1 Tax=Candidatus Roizmanbacteria bacterium RIFCSPHIGHO2_01_FULL_39_12c TaxID=1802031 RepID=A0A1F7GAJ3_9BACT|nr:MAG: hypothetical protein A2774_02635 [Candidatus Roizmanbacteria bacterium RIFCSPHIGHO2_01_FULL_39_12c]